MLSSFTDEGLAKAARTTHETTHRWEGPQSEPTRVCLRVLTPAVEGGLTCTGSVAAWTSSSRRRCIFLNIQGGAASSVPSGHSAEEPGVQARVPLPPPSFSKGKWGGEDPFPRRIPGESLPCVLGDSLGWTTFTPSERREVRVGAAGGRSLLEFKESFPFVKLRPRWNQAPSEQEITKVLGSTWCLLSKKPNFFIHEAGFPGRLLRAARATHS